MQYSIWGMRTHMHTNTLRGSQALSFSEGKHANMNSQSDQQQLANGCNHQVPNQNRRSQHVDRPEVQTLPMPVPDPTIQYTKVSYSQQSRVEAAHLGIMNCWHTVF